MTNKSFYLGIDVGKYHHQATLINQDQQIVGQSIRFNNTLSDFESLCQTIRNYVPDLTQIKAGLEATGHYYWHLKNYLENHGFSSVLVFNPIMTQQLAKTKMRKVKNDRIDSFLIAQMVAQHQSGGFLGQKENKDLKQLKELARFCEKLKSQKRYLKQQLSVLIERICPEFSLGFRDVFSKTAIKTIKEYFLNNLTPELLVAEIVKTSRQRIDLAKAQEIVKTLDNSLGQSFRGPIANLELKMTLNSLDLILEQIKEVKDQVEKMGQEFEEIEYLTSIPGISTYSASAIFVEIGQIDNFDFQKQLTAFAGLDPSVKESGQYQRKQGNHISKRGSKYLRKQLYYAAKTAVIFDPELKSFYQKKKSQGKHYNVIIIAVARKILKRCFTVLKQKRPYELRSGSKILVNSLEPAAVLSTDRA